jgi:hypothetical protein
MKRPEHSHWAVAINALALTGVLLIMAGLVWVMYHYTRPERVDQARIAERRKNLAELNAQAKEVLENYAWIDQTKGLVRLPVARAMELTVSEWQNPAGARSNLLWRLEKATARPTQLPPTNSAPSGGNQP